LLFTHILIKVGRPKRALALGLKRRTCAVEVHLLEERWEFLFHLFGGQAGVVTFDVPCHLSKCGGASGRWIRPELVHEVPITARKFATYTHVRLQMLLHLPDMIAMRVKVELPVFADPTLCPNLLILDIH
jgi:hypothetical protein